jgi:hypothetical protein
MRCKSPTKELNLQMTGSQNINSPSGSRSLLHEEHAHHQDLGILQWWDPILCTFLVEEMETLSKVMCLLLTLVCGVIFFSPPFSKSRRRSIYMRWKNSCANEQKDSGDYSLT